MTREGAGHSTTAHELEEELRSVSHHTEQHFLGNESGVLLALLLSLRPGGWLCGEVNKGKFM